MYRKDRDFSKRTNNYEGRTYAPSTQGRPPVSDGSNYDTTINTKIMKDLPNSSYAVKVDPYTESNNPATPYAFINRFNKIIGGKYSGVENLNGGNLIQYNSAVNSKFLKIFDSALLSLGLNYRYLPVLASDTTRGGDMVDEMRKAISEIVSSLNATTFKDQNIFYYAVKTNLPMGSAPVTSSVTLSDGTTLSSDADGNIYEEIEDVIYAMCMEYQLILQDVIFAFNMFNANRSRMGTMIRMSWNREVPVLNSYFGLLKKKSFLALFDSIALNIQGEYVDLDWMRQANTVNMVAARRSNSINDPVLEVIAHHNKPTKFKCYVATTISRATYAADPVYDYGDLAFDYNSSGTATSFDTAIRTLATRLSIEDTLDWARNVVNGGVSENDRFNEIKGMLDVVTYSLNIFKTCFTDLRTVLTIMARVGVVNWSLGTRLMVTRDTDCEMTNYLVVKDIYELVLSGAREVEFNDTTKRWRSFALWNMYYGTPEYAERSGGAFLSFSAKTLSYTGTPENLGYLPIAFTTGSLLSDGGTYYCVALNRIGKRIYVTRAAQGVTYSSNAVYTRLVPLTSQSSLKGYVPYPIEIVNGSPTTQLSDDVEKSFMYKFLLQVAGLGLVGSDYSLDPDTLTVFEYEIEDFTNEVISYCRGNGPFRVSAHIETSLGYYGLAQGRK